MVITVISLIVILYVLARWVKASEPYDPVKILMREVRDSRAGKVGRELESEPPTEDQLEIIDELVEELGLDRSIVREPGTSKDAKKLIRELKKQ